MLCCRYNNQLHALLERLTSRRAAVVVRCRSAVTMDIGKLMFRGAWAVMKEEYCHQFGRGGWQVK
jgi:hypothetical protein